MLSLSFPIYNFLGLQADYGMCFYDEYKRPLMIGEQMKWGPFGSEEIVVQIPNDAFYFRTTFYSDSFINYNGYSKSDFNAAILASSTPSIEDDDEIYQQTLTSDEICDYFAIDSKGATTKASGYGCSYYIDISDANYLRIRMMQETTSSKYGLAFYDENKELIEFYPNLIGQNQGSLIRKIRVPLGSKYFRTTYYDFSNSFKYGKWECKISYSNSEIEKYRPYQEDPIYFSREINQTIDKSDPNAIKTTTGVLYLPKNYSQTGKKTKLIMYFHGYSHLVYMEQWGTSENFLKQKKYFTEHGYAVMDSNGARNNNMQNHFTSGGSPQYVDGYYECYRYIIDNYNIDPEIFVVGGSAGGPGAINFCYWHKDITKALQLLSPWVSLEACSWGQGVRNTLIEYLGMPSDHYDHSIADKYDPWMHIHKNEDGIDVIDDLDIPVHGFYGEKERSNSWIMNYFVPYMNALSVSYPHTTILKEYPGLEHTHVVSGAVLEVDSAICDFFDSFN